MSRVLPRTVVVASLAVVLCGCDGDVLTLGRGQPALPTFGTISNLSLEFGSTSDDEANPSLTADLLQIVFTSDLEGDDDTGVDVFTAERASPDAPFGMPRRLTEVSTDGFDTSPSISLDGRTLWVGSEVPGSSDNGDEDLDIYRFTRASSSGDWGNRTAESELNSSAKDIPRPLAMNETVMPLGSQRSEGVYQTYLAERAGPDAPFGTPTLIAELVDSDRSTVDAFLWGDGRLLFFNWEKDNDEGDLYMTWRRSVNEPFAPPMALDELNTDGDERDPWLSPDGKSFFFTSDRDSPAGNRQLDIFEVSIQLPRLD
jgi:Tol biopolymer transport system component